MRLTINATAFRFATIHVLVIDNTWMETHTRWVRVRAHEQQMDTGYAGYIVCHGCHTVCGCAWCNFWSIDYDDCNLRLHADRWWCLLFHAAEICQRDLSEILPRNIAIDNRQVNLKYTYRFKFVEIWMLFVYLQNWKQHWHGCQGKGNCVASSNTTEMRNYLEWDSLSVCMSVCFLPSFLTFAKELSRSHLAAKKLAHDLRQLGGSQRLAALFATPTFWPMFT